MAPTSYPMALAVLVPLPFDIISTVLRFWIRTKRNAWGPDDWAMLINIVRALDPQSCPFWSVSTIATLGMAWSGVGQYDATLTQSQYMNSLRWFYVFQEPWCFTLITIKCSIGFALIRIASGKKWIEYVIYISMLSCFVVMGGTGMYLFFQCMPVQKNWDTKVEGYCRERSTQTILSYAVAAVSISTDWIFATLPIFLLWDVQLDWRVKGGVMGMLGLGIFASIAPIVRLKYLIGLNDASRLLQNLSAILAWATAEMNVGMFVANLPACHPLLKHAIARFSTWSGSNSRSYSSGIFGSKKPHPGGPSASNAIDSKNKWLELDDQQQQQRPESSRTRNYLSNKGKGTGVETKIYGDLEDYGSEESLDARDDGSQKRIVKKPSLDGLQVNVQKDFRVEVSERFDQRGRGRGKEDADRVQADRV
ncbi:hypothetical protein COCMIDRAFT_25245 [Bipolaris oryzae ATCC 44560]|uniref:Rhodopsin domain-containing protein n=1 Tax=Bipolaris oryzae ATCC 44560 TaxID=930090 RepID=W6Z4U8_COCMI|nr:uncharacterized protein COCMIDRAFT_25245 [Bipolaris oryzae ATCC 44560]EUC46767.1 hypothetical protein COCMIDRAFT_25245 [Bipolaris oryzae ATCC 44560]